MQTVHEKAAILAEALPYIRKFNSKIIVIKYGGSTLSSTSTDTVMQDIALMKFCGMHPVIVHGGGPDISALCKKLNIEPKFIDGLRVTDAQTMEIAQMVLLGKTNREIVKQLHQHGVTALGLSGQDGGLMTAKKHQHFDIKTNQKVDLGFVGDIVKINTHPIETLINADYVPVIAPIGLGEDKNNYNINADIVAGEIAAALKAEKLVFLTDVDGIYADKTNPASVQSKITVTTAKNWIQEGKLQGGMIPKLNACFKALAAGTRVVHIIDGRIPHSLLLEIFTDKGIGTMVVEDCVVSSRASAKHESRDLEILRSKTLSE